MIVQNLKHPFYHTIIYDVFNGFELNQIMEEKKYLESLNPLDYVDVNDAHHIDLFEKQKVKSYGIQRILNDSSRIKDIAKKIYNLKGMGILGEDNPYLRYIDASTQENLFLNIYKNGSRYDTHYDTSTLTALYVMWEGNGRVNGGSFVFNEYNYRPYLTHNSCLIFPSYLDHEVEELFCDDAVSRITINQRFYII
jgi:2OG-Fe(II) oxygenase superfamily